MITAKQAPIKFVDLVAQRQTLEPALSEAIARVLDRGDFIMGEAVEAFENEYAAYCGVAHAVGVDSGFSALELALRAAGIGPGDEVITQTNSFIASASAVMAVGATPVLTDCTADGAVDPEAIAAAVTPRTRAILPVHLFGRVADLTPIVQLAERIGAVVIEDACQAHGARVHGRRAGSFGLASAFSFYPGKNLGAYGDGGMVVTNSDELAAMVRSIRNYGTRTKYEHVNLPLNHRLDTIQAAVLRVKLPHLDQWNARREYLADAYREQLEGLPLGLPAAEAPGRHVFHLFRVQLEARDGLRDALKDAGIETGIHYPIALHQQPVLQSLGYRAGAFPNAERLAATSLSLPMFPELSSADVERVSAEIRRFLKG